MHRPASLIRLTLGVGIWLLVLGVLTACSGGGSAQKAATLKTVAGDGGEQLGDGGPATKAGLCGPTDVALDREGNMYIADTENNRIRKVDKDGIIHTVAGTGKEGYSGDGGPATEAALNLPTGIALDGEGNLFIACHHNSRVRKVDRNGTIETVAGTGQMGFNRENGPATNLW